jgi:predicted negative regulator of RcsB-dependent stress response
MCPGHAARLNDGVWSCSNLLPAPANRAIGVADPQKDIDILETTTRTRTTPLAIRENGPLAVNTNRSSTAFFDRIQNNRVLAMQIVVVVIALIIVIGAAWAIYSYRSNAASNALAEAMQTYDTPISSPDEPVPPSQKSFASLQARAQAAYSQFSAVAGKYGMTAPGRNAQYLAGVTALQSGQTAEAERLLKKSASDWNRDVANLAQLSLAGIYHSTNRDALAIQTYQNVIRKPSTVVPAGLAQLQLAELYQSNGNTAESKKILAQIKDKDPKSAAADLATQKLSGTPAQ